MRLQFANILQFISNKCESWTHICDTGVLQFETSHGEVVPGTLTSQGMKCESCGNVIGQISLDGSGRRVVM